MVQPQRKRTGKPVHCIMNSRRVREVVDHIAKVTTRANKVAADLTPQMTENDEEQCSETRNLVQRFASLAEMRIKYFKVIPWRFASAHTQQGAQECERQLRDTDPGRLDPFSLKIAETLLHDIELVALGHPASEALMKVVRKIWNPPPR